MGLRRDIRQRYNIEGSGGSDLYVLPPLSSALPISLPFRTAGARGASLLARSLKNHVKLSWRSKASLLANTHNINGLVHGEFHCRSRAFRDSLSFVFCLPFLSYLPKNTLNYFPQYALVDKELEAYM